MPTGYLLLWSYRVLLSLFVPFQRTRLAVLRYNENASRAQARTRKGSKRFKVNMPRGRKGHFTVAAVKTAPTFGKQSHCAVWLARQH